MSDKVEVRALEYGMSLSAEEGIAIDRPIMLFMDQISILDAGLFPHLWPEN